jgi:hypothetical protein
MEIIGGHAVGFDEEPHRYYIDGAEVPSVTKILGGGKRTYYPASAAQRGTDVHALTALLDEGRTLPGEQAGPYIGWIRAWSDFKRDYHFKLLAAECMGIGLGTMPHAGTIDRIAVIEPPGGQEGRAILDIKTGGKTADHALQVAAYDRLETNYGRDFEWLGLVYLKENGTYSVEMVSKTARVMAFAEFVRRQGEYRGR